MSRSVRRALFCACACGCAWLTVNLAAPGRARGAPAEPPRLDSAVRGAIVDGGIGTGMVGDTLMFEVGAQWAGARSLRAGRWLLSWDALVAARGGYLANEHPYFFLIGGHERSWSEVGYRFARPGRFSPYLGVRLGSDVQILAHPGLSLSALDTVNSVDRVGGGIAGGSMRADFGASFLDDRRSLLLVGFVEEQLNAAETNTPAQAFTGGGIGARCDLARRLVAAVEASWGVTPARRQPLLGFTDRTTHVAAAAMLRQILASGMWLGAAISIARDSDHVVYDGSGATYDTTDAPRFDASVLFGVPLGRSAGTGLR